MMARLAIPQQALADTLIDALRPADAVITKSRSIPWASATFSGARHYFDIAVTGSSAKDAVLRFQTGLQDMEFDLPDHLVADILLANLGTETSETTLSIEALTVEIR